MLLFLQFLYAILCFYKKCWNSLSSTYDLYKVWYCCHCCLSLAPWPLQAVLAAFCQGVRQHCVCWKINKQSWNQAKTSFHMGELRFFMNRDKSRHVLPSIHWRPAGSIVILQFTLLCRTKDVKREYSWSSHCFRVLLSKFEFSPQRGQGATKLSCIKTGPPTGMFLCWSAKCAALQTHKRSGEDLVFAV